MQLVRLSQILAVLSSGMNRKQPVHWKAPSRTDRVSDPTHQPVEMHRRPGSEEHSWLCISPPARTPHRGPAERRSGIGYARAVFPLGSRTSAEIPPRLGSGQSRRRARSLPSQIRPNGPAALPLSHSTVVTSIGNLGPAPVNAALMALPPASAGSLAPRKGVVAFRCFAVFWIDRGLRF